MTQKRQLSPYELNQLSKYNLSARDFSSFGNKPVEYITGHVEFCHHDFLVTKDTLIPRIETEEIINVALENTNEHSKESRLTIVDVGTGTGCLGISTAIKFFTNGFELIDLYLIDISPEALKVAKLNAERLLLKEINVHILKSDLLTDFPPDIKIDLLLANLPYIPSARISTLDSSVKDFEPILALDGGGNGTDLINKLIGQLPLRISPNFIGIFEIDYIHSLSDFELIIPVSAIIRKDSFDQNRFLLLKTSPKEEAS